MTTTTPMVAAKINLNQDAPLSGGASKGLMNTAEEINRLHREVCADIRTTLQKAIRIGELLTQQKDKCGHGEWLPWLKANIPFSRQTVDNYRRLYQQRDKLLTVGNLELTEAYRLLAEEPPVPATNGTNGHKKAKLESRSSRIKRHRRRVEINGTPEVLEALDRDLVAPATAETISNLPKEYQAPKLAEAKEAYAKKKAAPASAPVITKTGQKAKPETKVPKSLTLGIVTADMVGKGFRAYNNAAGGPYQLSPGVSQLEADERRASMIGGSTREDHRKAYEKWERYSQQKVRERVLHLVTKAMSPLEVPKGHKVEAFQYVYGDCAEDHRELVAMLCADLLRSVEELEFAEKYGHLTD